MEPDNELVLRGVLDVDKVFRQGGSIITIGRDEASSIVVSVGVRTGVRTVKSFGLRFARNLRESYDTRVLLLSTCLLMHPFATTWGSVSGL